MRSLDTKRKEQASAEQRLIENTTSSQLAEKELNALRLKKNQLERQHVSGLKELLSRVIPGHDLKSAELGVKEAERAYADAKDKVVRRKNMEEQAFESILSDKTDDGKVADKIKKAEDLEIASLQTLTELKEKMPSWRKWLELETAIPEKVSELEEIYAAQKALEIDVQDKKPRLSWHSQSGLIRHGDPAQICGRA
ncbi:hypothetical protein PInf_004796 [Phytophthora infestans]|nr:hypothetical protein PInf_004796 [Phytophthora infestans]